MDNQTVFARGCPQSFKIVETYHYEQLISRNPSKQPVKRPEGSIDITIPYDGKRYFPRHAYFDVERQSENLNSNHKDALIGHLILSNYSNVDLKGIPGFMGHYDSLPIKIPVRTDGVSQVDLLCDDKYTAHLNENYSPVWPGVIPVNVEMNLFDEDQLSEIDPDTLKERLLSIYKEITHQANFKRHLFLELKLKVDLSSNIICDNMTPRISKASISWPSITSLRKLGLQINGQQVPIRYNPIHHCLEWEDINLKPESNSNLKDTNIKTYQSPSMFLIIHQPGDLYQQDMLEGHVEIEIPGVLLSGMSTRFFNSVGEFDAASQPELVSMLKVDTQMKLGDAFSRRTFYPCMHLHFDEVIPDEMRMADIRTTLVDRGFNIVFDESLVLEKSPILKRFILARRSEGPNSMDFWITVEGKRLDTQRKRLDDSQTYTTQMESGQMKIYFRGELKGEYRALTSEMNIIQTILHERFERIRAIQ